MCTKIDISIPVAYLDKLLKDFEQDETYTKADQDAKELVRRRGDIPAAELVRRERVRQERARTKAQFEQEMEGVVGPNPTIPLSRAEKKQIRLANKALARAEVEAAEADLRGPPVPEAATPNP